MIRQDFNLDFIRQNKACGDPGRLQSKNLFLKVGKIPSNMHVFQFGNKIGSIILGCVEFEFQIQNRQAAIFDDHRGDNHCKLFKISAFAADFIDLSFRWAPESKQLGDQLRNLRKTKKYIGKITKMPKVVFGVKS